MALKVDPSLFVHVLLIESGFCGGIIRPFDYKHGLHGAKYEAGSVQLQVGVRLHISFPSTAALFSFVWQPSPPGESKDSGPKESTFSARDFARSRFSFRVPKQLPSVLFQGKKEDDKEGKEDKEHKEDKEAGGQIPEKEQNAKAAPSPNEGPGMEDMMVVMDQLASMSQSLADAQMGKVWFFPLHKKPALLSLRLFVFRNYLVGFPPKISSKAPVYTIGRVGAGA
jgi:hypothetical protein